MELLITGLINCLNYVLSMTNTLFEFVAKHPASMLVAGGILCVLLNKDFWAILLIGLGVMLHLLWLDKKN